MTCARCAGRRRIDWLRLSEAPLAADSVRCGRCRATGQEPASPPSWLRTWWREVWDFWRG